MVFRPKFTITPKLLSQVEAISAIRQQIQDSAIDVAWIPALQRDTRVRNAHSSTAIEGNPLTLEQVRAIEENLRLFSVPSRAKREVLNYLAGLRYIEKCANRKQITHKDVFQLHSILADGVMDQGEPGKYRTVELQVGQFFPPAFKEVRELMRELLDWWNHHSKELSPVLSQAIVHYRFEAIHPFADGNGRTGRALALWELYARGFDTHHIFSVDEFYWEDRPRYYRMLKEVREKDEDMTIFFEYAAEGLLETLEKAWRRIQQFAALEGKNKLLLSAKQEQVLFLLKAKGSMLPREIWQTLGISKQGAQGVLKPLLEAGLIKRVGTQKSGKYVLGG